MRLSVQLYTVRDAMASDPVGTLTKLKSFGLDFVEVAGNAGASTARESKKILDDLGLKVSGSHTGVTEGLDQIIEDNQTMGNETLILPWAGEAQYGLGWDKFAQSLEPIAQKIKAAGLNLAYHNHDFEFQVTDGVAGLDLFYSNISADLMKAELDLAWVKIGGQDPVSYIQKYADRVAMVHLKDFDPTKTPRWVPAGQGEMDLEGAIAASRAAGVQFGVIELDESPGDPLDAVKASVEYFHSQGLN